MWPCWVLTISVLILAYAVTLFREEPRSGVLHRLWGVLRHVINQSDACGRWRWSCIFIVIVVRVKTFVSTLVSVIKVNKPFLYVLSNVFWYYTHLSIICLKFWSWHTYEMHSFSSEKTGVTVVPWLTREGSAHPSLLFRIQVTGHHYGWPPTPRKSHQGLTAWW
jgi:hypothetical protein